ncbi:MAG: D-aminoacyl-tRNA deacylase [Bacteroidota bacterium]|nr:D-aminoacyl-tRNA deacylase [Bacteroidota bacterium]MDE2834985.1 D-aminoacyl-tRNA deacylase [Bacteroidota bacterium]MDE2956037.1 D-aminoacyl-tRNA deacylase [Bacteroidota bacterium]
MIALVQRVLEASVMADDIVTGAIGPGLLILLGVHRDDGTGEADWLARKCAHMRIFPDDTGNMNTSLIRTGGEALVVSQFTLYGDAARGHRPSFTHAARPRKARQLYERFLAALSAELQKPVAQGVFGAMMKVRLINDGPVTIMLERKPTSQRLTPAHPHR